MSILIVRSHQIGIDGTASNNFSFEVPAVPDGTLKFGRGNAMATISTIFTVDASNNITFTGDVYGAQPTGMFAQFMLPSAPPGWIAGNGTTIGNVGSGATRANVDTLALFTAWWTGYTNAQLPILTSTGAASTRGASAAADWAALKRLTVFDVQSRFVRNADGVSTINGTKYSETVGPHTHLTATSTVALPGTGGTYGYTYNNVGTGAPVAPGVQTGANAGAETAPINIGMLGCFKL